jgi:hypothetical protein
MLYQKLIISYYTIIQYVHGFLLDIPVLKSNVFILALHDNNTIDAVISLRK